MPKVPGSGVPAVGGAVPQRRESKGVSVATQVPQRRHGATQEDHFRENAGRVPTLWQKIHQAELLAGRWLDAGPDTDREIAQRMYQRFSNEAQVMRSLLSPEEAQVMDRTFQDYILSDQGTSVGHPYFTRTRREPVDATPGPSRDFRGTSPAEGPKKTPSE